MLNLSCATGSHTECDGWIWNGDDTRDHCECDCHGLARGISTPVPDEPTETMAEALDALGIVIPDGAVPTREQVEAVIARRGRWGDPPKMLACRACGFYNAPDAAECVACNESAWRR
jgi:hypothetical protein